MSVVVISKVEPGIVLVSDRRSVIEVRAQIGSSDQQLVHYHDGVRKIYFFAKQIHAFLAVTSQGSEPRSFNVSDLMSQFEETLPNHRLHIKEYAKRLSKFLAARYPTEGSSINEKDRSTFNIVGYDFGIDNPQHYEFKLPDIVEPYPVDATVRLVGDLTHDVVETAKREIAQSVKKRLEELARTKTTLDIHEQKGLKTLSMATGDPLEWMNLDEHQAFAKNLIKARSEALTQADEIEAVGTETDVIIISRRTGVDPIEYGDDDPKLSDSETATHFISVECCGLRQKFQLDGEKPLREGYTTFPPTAEFVCKICGSAFPLSKTKAEFDLEKYS